MTRHDLNRRDALRKLTTGVGAAAAAGWVEQLRVLAQGMPAHALLASRPATQAEAPWKPKVLTPHEFQTVGVLVERIIPATDTPGAKALLVDRYVDAVLEAADSADRAVFVSGLKWLDARSRTLFNKDFVAATAGQQTDLLTRLSFDSVMTAAPAVKREARKGLEFFAAIKAMTIAGYYTTEVGLRQELGDDGRLMLAEFEGCTHPEHQ